MKPSITHALNTKTGNAIRWCTPSIEPSAARVLNHYDSDMSISYESLGFPFEPSGIFKTAYDHAAKVYKADRTLFGVNGSTGSNFVVLRALSKQIPNLRILAQRNVHKSIVCACEDYNINIVFLPPHVDPLLQIFYPNNLQEILRMIEKVKPNVLLLTNPTYEGIVLDTKKLIKQIRKLDPHLIVFIEEAWGAHLPFSKKLPISAMEAGADICVQSTHKQGGGLQQTSMIHWKEKRINSSLLVDSYRGLSTSSPSFLLLASLEAATHMMEKKGKRLLKKSLQIAALLSKGFEAIQGVKVVSTKELQARCSGVFSRDETKIILDVSASGYTGPEIAHILEKKYHIIIEKYTMYSLLFLVPFQSTIQHAHDTIRILTTIISKKKPSNKSLPPLHIPQRISKILEVSEVAKLLQNQIEKVPLAKAQGRIAAENISPYPPGIPTTVKGEEFTGAIVSYYMELKKLRHGHIDANDLTLESVSVVK